jgi:hypothetical protein
MALFIEFSLFGLDQLEEEGFADAQVRRFDQELLDQGAEGFDLGLPGGGALRPHKAPLPWMNLQNALGREFADGFLNGVGIDPELLADGAHGREPVARQKPPGCHGAFDGMDELFIDRLTGLELDGKRKHGKERTPLVYHVYQYTPH